MKKLLILSFLVFCFSGCSTKGVVPSDDVSYPTFVWKATPTVKPLESIPTPKLTFIQETPTAVISPTSTPMKEPGVTERPADTATITPSATFVITPPKMYDASSAVTHTPAAPANCP